MKVPFKVKRVTAIAFMLMVSMAWLSCSDWEAVKVVKQPNTNGSIDSLSSLEEIDISGSMQGVDFFKLFAGKKNIVFMDGDDTIGMVLNMGENTHYIYKENELDIKTVTYTSKDNMGVVVVSAKNAIITAYTPKLEGVYIAMFNKSNNEDADKIKEKRDVSGTEEEKLHLSGYWFNGDNTAFKMKPKANAKPSACKETSTSSVSIPSLLDMVYTSPGTDPNIFSDASVSGSSSTSSDDAPPSGGYVPSWGTKRWVQNEDQNRMMEVLLGVSNDYIALSRDADLTSYPSGVENGQFYCYTNPSNGQKKFYVVSEMMYEFIGPHSYPGMNGTTKVGQVYVYDNPYTGLKDYFVAKQRINEDAYPTNRTSNDSWKYVASTHPDGRLFTNVKRWVQDDNQNRMMEVLLRVSNDYIALSQDVDLTSYPSGVENGQFYCYTNPSNGVKKFYTIEEMAYEFIGPHSYPGMNSIAKVGKVYVYDNIYTGATDYFVAKKRINTDWFPTNQTSNSSWGYVTSVYPGGQTEAEYLLMSDLLSGKNTDYETINQHTVVNLVKDQIYQIVDNRVPYKKFYRALQNSPWWGGTYVRLDDQENFKLLGPYEWPGKDVSGVANGIYVSVNETSGRLDYWRLRKARNTDFYPTMDKLNNSSWAYVGTENSQFFTVAPTSSKIADYVLLKEKADPMSSTSSGWYSPGAVYYSWAQDRNGSWYRKYYKVVDDGNYSYVYRFMGPMMLPDLITTDFSPSLRGQVGSVFRRYNIFTKKAAYFKLRVKNITQGIPMDKSNNDTWEYIGDEDDINTVTVKEYPVTSNYISHEAGWTWNNFITTMESINATTTITFVRSVQTDWDITGDIGTKIDAFRQRLLATFTHPEPNTVYALVSWSPPPSIYAGKARTKSYRFDALQYYTQSSYPQLEFPCATYHTIADYTTGAHELSHVLGAEHNSQMYGEWKKVYKGAGISSKGQSGGFWVYDFYFDIMHPDVAGRPTHKLSTNISTIKRLLGITK